MITYEAQVRTPWPAAKAFAYLADMSSFDEWDPGTKSAVLVSGKPGELGSTYDLKAGVSTFHYEITELSPGLSFTAQATTGMLHSKDTVTVREAEGGCVVTYNAELQPTGVLRIAEPVVKILFRRAGDQGAAGLAAKLDGELITS